MPAATHSRRGPSEEVRTMSKSKTSPPPDEMLKDKPKSSSAAGVLLAAGVMISGCMANNIFLEYIVSDKKNRFADKDAGPLLTLLQFLFVVAITLPGQMTWKSNWLPTLKALKIPVRIYVYQTAIFFVMSYLNNLAFSFNISQPTHMLFRSSSLIASLAFGACIGERYSMYRVLAVVIITVGVATATLAEAMVGDTARKAGCCDEGAILDTGYLVTWGTGILTLVGVIFLGVVLSHYQRFTNKRRKPTTNETMFMTHAMSIVVFLVVTGPHGGRLSQWSSSSSVAHEFETQALGPLGEMPVMWFYVVGNILTQAVCAKGVHMLVNRTDAVTLTMFLTLRKFLSLLFSVMYFGNAFTLWHWLGAAAVFGGVALYTKQKT